MNKTTNNFLIFSPFNLTFKSLFALEVDMHAIDEIPDYFLIFIALNPLFVLF